MSKAHFIRSSHSSDLSSKPNRLSLILVLTNAVWWNSVGSLKPKIIHTPLFTSCIIQLLQFNPNQGSIWSWPHYPVQVLLYGPDHTIIPITTPSYTSPYRDSRNDMITSWGYWSFILVHPNLWCLLLWGYHPTAWKVPSSLIWTAVLQNQL